ncbi:MAG: transcription-repair coupling factor [Spirochaetaceae bacterium]|nr:MAG: transcription-repair coupling factor [Spirochaetaceae bacterium]
MKEVTQRLRTGRFPLSLRGPKSAFTSYMLSRIAGDSRGPILVIVPNESEIAPLRSDLALFNVESITLPSWGTTAYGAPSLRSTVWGERMRALVELQRNTRTVVVAPLRALVMPTATPKEVSRRVLTLEKGRGIDPAAIARDLVSMGYWRVPKVSVHGEFALRGEVLDIFLPGWEHPCRAVFDYDEISGIKVFDVDTQTSIDTLPVVKLYPLRETPHTTEQRATLLQGAAAWPEMRATRTQLPDLEEQEILAPHWTAALNEEISHRTTPLDFLHETGLVVWLDRQRHVSLGESIRREYESVFAEEHFRRALPRPDRVLMDVEALIEGGAERSIHVESMADTADTSAIHLNCDPPRSFFGNVDYLKEELSTLLATKNRVIVLADTETQQKRIAFLLRDYEVDVLLGRISGGFALPEQRLLVIQENEIFGRRRRAPASLRKTESAPIETFLELDEGDYIVHLNYGIGRYRGIRRMIAAGNERDYIHLEYAEEESIFTPIEQVNLIQRYIGSGGATPRLDRIGGKSWERRKDTVRKNVEDLAERLIALYSRRKKARGYAFPPDTEWQLDFESTFPWEETEDQLRCMVEIKQDMEKPEPMDRLVCGDVGYGKTELALRAAFKAVASGKQVAFLAPTTILAEQHYENLLDRFERFPVRIAMLSRFVGTQDKKKALTGLAAGEVDLVVGTHSLLQKNVHFRDLGLLIVDEEQRFGVRDKERLKELKHSVDCLTMTATPIPRTLHMSLLKIRDMSLLRTPPHNRHPVETVIAEFDEETIAAAIRREVSRDGQVFFLHNRVETLEHVQQFIERLVPEVLVEAAHGQMNSGALEDIMHRFVHGAFHVLVATTIIENGIDIPNVNTIIIDRADMYGISQLYQLRGRVGRSDRVAFAYLFYPEQRALSDLAMKRLEIISDFTELGSGFKIALKDLEVRGAGNLLGSRQSGDIGSIGFDLYLKLLDDAIREIDSGDGPADEEVYLELEYTGFIPDQYIQEPMEKMEVYKKVASVSEDAQLESLVGEIEDRFGPMPEEVQSLLGLAEIRILARRLHVSSLRERRGRLEVEFGKVASVSVDRVLALIGNSGGAVALDPHRPNVLLMETGRVGLKEKSEFISGRLAQLL